MIRVTAIICVLLSFAGVFWIAVKSDDSRTASFLSIKNGFEFDYPASWTVESFKQNSGDGYPVDIIRIKPPQRELFATEKGTSNVIEVFTADRIHHPLEPAMLRDDRGLFDEFDTALTDQLKDSRFIHYTSDRAGNVNLKALIRDGETVVGLSEDVCNPSFRAECVTIFQSIVESFREIKNP